MILAASPIGWGPRALRRGVVVVEAEGGEEVLSCRQIADDSSRFAHWLVAQGIAPGDRVAVMLEPSRAFYMAVFGAMKAGAIAVPLFTLFGPDGVKLRIDDCRPRLLVTNPDKAPAIAPKVDVPVVVADAA